jgi:hypothetical protein
MTYNEILLNHYQYLKDISNNIETDMKNFLFDNKDVEDKIKLCISFERKFNDIIWGFHDTYSRTCPEIISDTDYSHFAINNSQKIAMDLRETYKQHIKDIESTFPPMDDFQEIQI